MSAVWHRLLKNTQHLPTIGTVICHHLCVSSDESERSKTARNEEREKETWINNFSPASLVRDRHVIKQRFLLTEEEEEEGEREKVECTDNVRSLTKKSEEKKKKRKLSLLLLSIDEFCLRERAGRRAVAASGGKKAAKEEEREREISPFA